METNRSWFCILVVSIGLVLLIIHTPQLPIAVFPVAKSVRAPNKDCSNVNKSLPFKAAKESLASNSDKMTNVDLAAVTNAQDFILQKLSQAELATNEQTASRVCELALSDPHAAAALLAGIPPGSTRDKAITGLAVAWANQNSVDAAVWADQLPEASERQLAMILVGNEVARTEPMAALTLAAELPANPARDDLIVHAAAQWAATTPESAADWAEQISDVSLRQRALSAVATEWGNSDPTAAADLALQVIPPGKLQDDAVIGIVERWAQVDLKATVAWVQNFPVGSLRDTVADVLDSFVSKSL